MVGDSVTIEVGVRVDGFFVGFFVGLLVGSWVVIRPIGDGVGTVGFLVAGGVGDLEGTIGDLVGVEPPPVKSSIKHSDADSVPR